LKVGYDGKQILFSGDSLWTESFIEHARSVDFELFHHRDEIVARIKQLPGCEHVKAINVRAG
jgi:hypothetical protein